MVRSELFAKSTIGRAVRIGRRESSGRKKWIPIPEGLDWDMWLGPAPERPFNKAYLPFVWRGWYDFGDGSFGDMGCYSFAGVFTILNLTPPVSVESSTTPRYDETFPKASIVYLNFPAVDHVRRCACPGMTEDSSRPAPRASVRRISGCSKAVKRAKAFCTLATRVSCWADSTAIIPAFIPNRRSTRRPPSGESITATRP